jgi:hypothetical protein
MLGMLGMLDMMDGRRTLDPRGLNEWMNVSAIVKGSDC